MNTRIERIGTIVYCAYCGKSLRDYDCGYAIHPEPQLTCNCEKAKEELDLYDKLKKLYNVPLAENLIDIKVQKYKNELLGIKVPVYNNGITCINTKNVINTITDDEVINAFG